MQKEQKKEIVKVVEMPYSVFETLTNFLDSSGLAWSKLNPLMQLLSQTITVKDVESKALKAEEAKPEEIKEPEVKND